MAFSRLALGALVAALASPVHSEGVKWVPLGKAQPAKPKPDPAPAQAAPSAPVVELPQAPPNTATATVPPVPMAADSTTRGRLDLTCFGSGTANKMTATTAYGNSYVSGQVGTVPFSGTGGGATTVYGKRQQDFGDQVDVRLFSGDDRIRMPRTMLPPIRGGKDGWFKLKNVVTDARSIRAKAAVNFANNPNVFIDRVTGTISISGRAGDYSGQCQAIDASAPPKF